MAELAAAARKVQATRRRTSGATTSRMTDKDFTWYFLYHGIHNRGGDIISKDGKRVTFTSPAVIAATQSSVDLVLKHKVQPPGRAVRPRRRRRAVQGRPDRLPPGRAAAPRGLPRGKLPFKWDFVNPVGAAGKRTIFSTTGHWVMASKGKNKDAAWELVKFLSSPAFANEFGAHYGWAPVRSDVNTSKGDAQVKRVNKYVLEGWDGLPTGPKMAQLTERLRPGDRGRGDRQEVGQGRAWPRRRRTAPRS